GFVESDSSEFAVEIQQVRFGDPTQNDVLFNGRTQRVCAKASRKVRQLASLSGCQIAQWQRNCGDHVTYLLLAINVCRKPLLETFGPLLSIQERRRFLRILVIPSDIRQKTRPALVSRHRGPLLEHDPPEFFDSKFADQKLDTGCRTILLFTDPGENARDRLSQWQQFFFRHKLIEKFSLMRHGTKTTANVDFEATLFPTVLDVSHRNATHVVHVRESASLFTTSGKSDLEFSA